MRKDPEDWTLLGFQWQGKYYYEKFLPFGLTSACRKWELFSNALHFFLTNKLKLLHWLVHSILDDFLLITSPAVGMAGAELPGHALDRQRDSGEAE